jgi:hypothetical protein
MKEEERGREKARERYSLESCHVCWIGYDSRRMMRIQVVAGCSGHKSALLTMDRRAECVVAVRRSTCDARPRNELVEVVDVMNLAGGLHRVRFPSGHDAAALSTNGLTLRSAP